MISKTNLYGALKAGTFVLVGAGCVPAGTFDCRDAAGCDGSDGGVCLSDGACAYPEDVAACPSGLRRSDTASVEPGGCVPPQDAGSTTSSATSQSADTTQAGSDTSPGEMTSSTTGDSGGEPVMAEVEASIAQCLAMGNVDPEQCAPVTGRFVVDAGPAPSRAGYLRFDVPVETAEAEILALRLVLSVPEGCMICDSALGGEVYAVEPFTEESLSAGPPEQTAILATGVGPAQSGASLEVELPVDSVPVDGLVFLSLVATSADEAHFWSTSGLSPPRLVVLVRP